MLTIPNEMVPVQIARGLRGAIPYINGISIRIGGSAHPICGLNSRAVSPALLLLVLVAAVFHATWNAMLKAAEAPLALAARATALGTLAALPPVAALWLAQGRPGMPPMAWLIVITSAVLELLYFVALTNAYQRGELSVVYPIARGTGPLIAVMAGLLILR